MSESPTVPYRTVLPLDRGGPFEVWRIEPVGEGRTVGSREMVPVPARFAGPPLVVKCLPPDVDDDVDRGEALRRDARLQQRVAHPGIAPVALVEFDGRPAIVSPLAWGSLDRLPLGTRTWSTREAAEALRRLADALAALHAAGIVHGDVAPTNVLLLEGDGTAPPTIALTDFGCAAEPGGPGPACGTPGAVAPEVVAGDGAGTAADVYGLGRVGQALLAATDPGRAAVEERSALEAWCDGLVDPDPRKRPAAAVAAATVPVASRVRTVEFDRRPRPPAQVEPARRRRSRTARVCTATVALAAVAVAVVLAATVGGRHHATCARSGSPGWLRRGVPRPFDVLGTGCAQQVTWSGTVLTVQARPDGDVRRYRLGRPGDELALARWGCTGRPRPAIYRPALGEVLAYPKLPAHAGPGAVATPTRHVGQAVDGQAHLVRDARGCAHLVVGARDLGPLPDR